MRRSALLIVSLAVVAGRLSAQGFEGTISVKTDSTDPNALRNEQFHVKGSQMAIVGTTGPTSQLGPGAEIRILVDWSSMKVTILLPLTGQMAQMAQMMPGMKGMKIVTDIPSADTATNTALKPLGTSQTIAGYKCYDFEETGTKTPHQMCLTKDLGHFAMPSAGGRGRGAGPSWASAIGNNGFPLKVVTSGGKVDFEATAVHKGTVPASVFAIPEGYVDPRSMGRGGF